MTILVTGAAGFIGSHMAERLHSLGHKVIGLDNFSTYYNVELKNKNADHLRSKGIEVLKIDLCDQNLSTLLPNEIEYIFHFAAQPGISKDSTFESYETNNLLATQNLLIFAQGLKSLKMFVNIATSSIYGVFATHSENVSPKPVSDYGVTKLAAEQLILSRARLNLLKACSLRLFSVYGPRERPDKLFTKLIDCAINKKPFPLYKGSLDHFRSFTFVNDIIDGIVSVIGEEKKCNTEIFNIGTEAEYSTKEGIETVENLLNTNINFDQLPARQGDQERTNANIDKARKILGYNPKTSLKEGLEAQVEWFKSTQ